VVDEGNYALGGAVAVGARYGPRGRGSSYYYAVADTVLRDGVDDNPPWGRGYFVFVLDFHCWLTD
jgi:hypothetical protein